MDIKIKKKSKLFFEKELKRKRLLIFFIGILIVGATSLVSMYYGAKIYRSGQVGSINYKIHDFAVSKLSFIPHYLQGISSNPDEFIIDLKFKDLQKFRYYRNNSFTSGDRISPEGKKNEVPAKLTFQGKTYKIKMGLTGTTLRHIADPEKWSYRIKIKDDASILRMKEFNLLYPTARGYLSDWIGHKLQEKIGLIAMRMYFVNVTINGNDLGLYCLEENYDKLLIENNNLREGIVFKWGDPPKIYNESKLDPILREKSIILNRFIKSFNIGDIGIDQLFDLRKMAKLFALNDLLNGGHHGVSLSNTRFYFNPVTNLIEPIGREWLITTNKYKHRTKVLTLEHLKDAPFFNKFFYNTAFTKLYIEELNKLSEPSFLDRFFNEVSEDMQRVTNIIYRDNPFYIYPKEFLYNNQNYIKSKIYPEKTIAAYYTGMYNNNLQLALKNLQCLPVRINNVVLNDSIVILPTQNSVLIGDNKSFSKYEIEEKRSHSKYEPIEFSIPKEFLSNRLSDKLKINYNLIGTDSIYTDEVFPWPYEETRLFSYNFTQQKPNYRNYNFLSIDSINNNIVFDSGELHLSSDLIIPDGYKVFINEDTKINLTNSSSIISYSPFKVFGSIENPIIITSSDSTGQGLFVLNTNEISEFDHVQFKNLSNPSKNGWELSGAIIFYQADVTINNCIFYNNLRGDDYLNIISSEFEINNTLFSDIHADAFDSDFGKGSISNSSFVNCGNDAIDISGTNLTVENIFIDSIGDKGLSAGENSQIIANNIKIENSEIAICSKDMSKIIISEVKLLNNQIGFNAFQKKSEFGSGHIEGSKVEMENVLVPYFIETLSSCTIDGKIMISNNDKVKDVLYGVKYGKSSN